MNTRRILLTTAATLLLCLGTASGGALQAQDMSSTVLTGQAEIHRVEAVRYGDAFPEGSEAAPDDAVLLFESHRPGEPVRREIVPGTEGAHRELSPHLLMDGDTDTLYMVWETRINTLHSRLHLVSRDADGWSETIEVSGNPYLFKGNLQMAVTRDTFVVDEGEDGEETTATHRRVVLHLIWTEMISETEDQVLYSPVILLDGEYIGWNPVYPLSELAAPALEDVESLLVEANYTPTIQPSLDSHAVVVGFLDHATGQWASLRLEVLSGELSFLGDAARAQIIETGMRRGLGGLADLARAQIIEVGHRFHPAMVQYLAEQIHQFILEQTPREVDVEALADLARAQIIEVGIRFRAGLNPIHDTARAQIIEVGHRLEPRRARHDLRAVLVRNQPMPEAPSEVPITMLLSDDGDEILLVWDGENECVHYRETGAEGWGPAQTLKLGSGLDRDQAYQLLEDRIHNR